MEQYEHIMVAGGGNFDDMPQQQMALTPEVHVEVVQPPQDHTLLWVSGVVVPLVIAIGGWWLAHRRRKG